MGLAGEEVVIVSDIGCSGLLDTFFKTHAFHGLHGRALTYATGIKLARPDLQVIVTMGDGGLGIGGAHVLSACRRNLDLTLLVLNNFNYGMTGGQCSATTPQNAVVSSGFLNKLESPLDICQVAGAAGAGMVMRVSACDKGLEKALRDAVSFDGFSLVDVWGICSGRYSRKNRWTPRDIAARLDALPGVDHYRQINQRSEYGRAYRQEAKGLLDFPEPIQVEPVCQRPWMDRRHEVVLLGRAGQRIITAGELLCLAGAAAGCRATQKNDYPITVMRGHCVSEIILSSVEIGFTGIEDPSVVIALAPESTHRHLKMLRNLSRQALLIKAAGLQLPPCRATVKEIDFKALGIRPPEWALASLALLARQGKVLTLDMLKQALDIRFKGKVRAAARSVVQKMFAG